MTFILPFFIYSSHPFILILPLCNKNPVGLPRTRPRPLVYFKPSQHCRRPCCALTRGSEGELQTRNLITSLRLRLRYGKSLIFFVFSTPLQQWWLSPYWRMNNSHKTSQIVRNQVPLFPVWVHWFFSSPPASAEAQRGNSRVSGEEGWKNSNAENCKLAAHLWILHQRAQMKGKDCVAAASAIIRKFDTSSEPISDDDMVSSLLWSTARPDADTWPARWGGLSNHLELKRSAFDK